ncbi:MAG: diguanylate cyclase [Spirochaetes bacterium]|nr:diguanylate cyclase [Spirochaetota bacterium]
MNSESKKNLVLLVSQNRDSFTDIIQILESNNFDVITAKSSTEALSVITFRLPNVIISDTELSDESGYNFCKKIRSGIKTKLIPFIFISENDKTKDRIKAIQEGADAYLTRPFDNQELLAHVQSKISQFNEFYLLSITDELTRLFNRKEFLNKFSKDIEENPDRIISLAIIDLDFFKKVNDVHGHQMGDIVLMKLAELLKENTSDSFFPTRFGGEEFVILFCDTHADTAKNHVEHIREKFSEIHFKTTNGDSFHVSFSGGIAEYPAFSNNLSELLSRADQALYAAKRDGRSRTYIFSPIMARNDSFWEYLKKEHGHFISTKFQDAVTNLPYLPQLLEKIYHFDFEISSIGLIILRLNPIYDIQNHLGFKVYDLAMENIKVIIEKSCANNFASDTYIGISDFFNYEFTILFPSLVDFALNPEKCRDLYGKIAQEINNKLKTYGIEIFYNNSILYLKKNDPKHLLADINSLRNRTAAIENRSANFEKFISDTQKALKTSGKISCFFKIDYIMDMKNNSKFIQIIVPAENACSFICMHFIAKYLIQTQTDLELFCDEIREKLNPELPVLFPWNEKIEPKKYIDSLKKKLPEFTTYLAVNEVTIYNYDFKYWNDIAEYKPENIKLCLNNCFINNDIMNLISICEFDLIILSEHLTKNLHYFKERIKVINGFKIFIDQMNIKVCAVQITQQEELQLIKDLNIYLINGDLFIT